MADDECADMYYTYRLRGWYIAGLVYFLLLFVAIIVPNILQAVLPKIKKFAGEDPTKKERNGLAGKLKSMKLRVVASAVFFADIWVGITLIYTVSSKFGKSLPVCGYDVGDYSCADVGFLENWAGLFKFNFAMYFIIYGLLAARRVINAFMWQSRYLNEDGEEVPKFPPNPDVTYGELFMMPDPDKEGVSGFKKLVMSWLLEILVLVFSPMIQPLLIIPLDGMCYHSENIQMIFGMAIAHMVLLILTVIGPFIVAILSMFGKKKEGDDTNCFQVYASTLACCAFIYIVAGVIMGLILMGTSMASDAAGLLYRLTFTICMPVFLSVIASAVGNGFIFFKILEDNFAEKAEDAEEKSFTDSDDDEEDKVERPIVGDTFQTDIGHFVFNGEMFFCEEFGLYIPFPYIPDNYLYIDNNSDAWMSVTGDQVRTYRPPNEPYEPV